ncbi:hypothetical protein HAX54_022475 [Datura stramonium]|uniref:Uncharacterized protein n=1 Tax=Datura stramonium TaxID=4076 RepID=A0ABS8UXC4_DATST|nr:hypothetical protein [Datura stramonium]
MRLSNNEEGLCYNKENGLGDDLEALLDSGIGHCGDSKAGPTKIVEHFSTLNTASISRAISDIRWYSEGISTISWKLGLPPGSMGLPIVGESMSSSPPSFARNPPFIQKDCKVVKWCPENVSVVRFSMEDGKKLSLKTEALTEEMVIWFSSFHVAGF